MLVRYAQPAKVRQAQDDRLIYCFVIVNKKRAIWVARRLFLLGLGIDFLEKKILLDKSLCAVAEQEGCLPCFEFCHQEFFALYFGKGDFVAQKGVASQILFTVNKSVFEIGSDA